ncbi:hypothetical protein GCM10011328_30280 [Hafnia psychrotolerans]|uniref:Uncharacterized protein n=1 Tax=Hafnia psychrotolerans TaxID=1477018 RepID=A0ABQ1GY75_9GAMM|nr:hypothetical protein GCM10011328_30280 [Hafnia psychrotolerans]
MHERILERKIITQVINLMRAADLAMKYLTTFLSDHKRLMPALGALSIVIIEASVALYILHNL